MIDDRDVFTFENNSDKQLLNLTCNYVMEHLEERMQGSVMELIGESCTNVIALARKLEVGVPEIVGILAGAIVDVEKHLG